MASLTIGGVKIAGMSGEGFGVRALSDARRHVAHLLPDEWAEHDLHSCERTIADAGADFGFAGRMLAAWEHGLRRGHIPVENHETSPVAVLSSAGQIPYRFVHVPIRAIRRNQAELVRRGIVNLQPDPARLIFHDDGIIRPSTLISCCHGSTGMAEVVCGQLAETGFLQSIEPTDPRINWFAGRPPHDSGSEPMYVLVEVPDRAPELAPKMAAEVQSQWSEIQNYLRGRTPCFFCSSAELTPHEAKFSPTLGSEAGVDADFGATQRRYQCGFTFAPFGDPQECCHFVAWDHPSAPETIADMTLADFSIPDLLALTMQANRGFHALGETMGATLQPSITGVCNHWAGNSIAHQHFQFFALPHLPQVQTVAAQLCSTTTQDLVAMADVRVWRVQQWAAPSYVVQASPELELDRQLHRVSQVGNMIAAAWGGEHNLVAVGIDSQPLLIFIPRMREKLEAACSQVPVIKKNAGVLEMLGYFIIDEAASFNRLAQCTASQLQQIGDDWLACLAPSTSLIEAFESRVLTTNQTV